MYTKLTVTVLVSYLAYLEDGLLIKWQAGEGVFAEAFCKGAKWQQTVRKDL